MRTPLYGIHVSLGARMQPFAEWDMPIQYRGILDEHAYTRSHASIFDTCHMGEFDIRGENAEADLERLVTQSVGSIQVGQCRYGYLLDEDGGVIDDLTVFRRDGEHFFLVVNAGTRTGDAEWIQAHLSRGTLMEDLSPHRAKLDVQGPESRPLLEAALQTPLPDLKYFRFTDVQLAGVNCTLSRTGYTGEWGYELFFDAQHTEAMWDRLTRDGSILPAGLGARDTLRLEVGYPLYGHELSRDRTPVAAAGSSFIDTGKEFLGKPAVMRDLESGTGQRLAGLKLTSRRAAREDDRVIRAGREVGRVTSGSVAPSLGIAVAMAYLDAGECPTGQSVEVEVRGNPLPATIVDLPFYREGTARKARAKP